MSLRESVDSNGIAGSSCSPFERLCAHALRLLALGSSVSSLLDHNANAILCLWGMADTLPTLRENKRLASEELTDVRRQAKRLRR